MSHPIEKLKVSFGNAFFGRKKARIKGSEKIEFSLAKQGK